MGKYDRIKRHQLRDDLQAIEYGTDFSGTRPSRHRTAPRDEQAAGFVLYTPASADPISLACEGTAIIDAEKYDLVIAPLTEGA